MTDPAPPTTVTGGGFGLAATYSRVRGLAATYDAAGSRMRNQAGLGARTLTNGDLAESALLAPGSFARAETAVLAATAGPDGILPQSLGWEADAVAIRVAVAALEAADELARRSLEVPGPVRAGVLDLLAAPYPDDGAPRVRPRPDLTVQGVSPPATLAGLLSHLAQVNDWSADGRAGNDGTIEIQSWTGPDGTSRHVVYLPGTDDLLTLPWTMDADVRDLPTNLLALGGRSTSYAEGILQAMRDAGVGPRDPVLLAGHSQGGIEATWIASHPSEFHITQVVTAGAPIGGMAPCPPGTQVLALENSTDLVPLLDGRGNRDATNLVTVTFADPGDLGDGHDLGHYVAGAAGVEASDDPSLTALLAGLRSDGFLAGPHGPVRTQAFQITRGR